MPDRGRPEQLDHRDLGAHSQHVFRFYGGEEVWVSDVRGDTSSEDPDVSVRFKNVHLTGRLSILQAFADLMSALLLETQVLGDTVNDSRGHLPRRPAGDPASEE